MAISQDLIDRLQAAKSVVVLTGAGVSAESGVPTFRQAQTGLWAKYRPEELATPGAFSRNPRLVWEWYEWRRKLVSAAQPNAGHYALAELEAIYPDFVLVTQNVDGLHRRAGSRNMLELHGNLTRTKCSKEGEVIESWDNTENVPPPCPRCGAPLRPDVVWFEEPLPAREMQLAREASARCDVFLAIGTSGVVYPAAWLPLEALDNQAILVEINPEPTPLTPKAHYALAGPSGGVLPEIVKRLTGVRAS
jgi:NAD-dependent deacetylase